MTVTARVVALLLLTAFFYTMLNLVPMILSHVMDETGPDNNGDCPYTLYQKYHPQQFNIPEGSCP